MKQLIHIVLTVLLFDVLLSQCANPQSPTGGPRDTIPPILVNSIPANGTLNYKDQEITLEFSEYVNADKLLQNLIITPKTNSKFKHVVKRNQLTIKFEEPFNDSTTYSLNFFDGVTDITEKNPAVNLIIAFSTGDFIDSMKVKGYSYDLLTQDPSKDFIVGLYPVTDSLDFLAHPPVYFTTANDSGRFEIGYVKSGSYRILSFKDENRNLILDADVEPHGFVSDTLNLYDSIFNTSMYTLLQDVKPLKFINQRAIGLYHEFRFNKQVHQYNLLPDSLYSNIIGENKDVVRIYNPNQFPYEDSISIVLRAYDSLNNLVHETLGIVFRESSRRPSNFSSSMTSLNKVLIDTPIYEFNFNKPVTYMDNSRFTFSADSSFTFSPDSLTSNWNYNRTNLQLKVFLDKDSLYSAYKRKLTADSINSDSTSLENLKESKIEFRSLRDAFISVESDSSKLMSFEHLESRIEKTGIVKLNLVTDKPSFTLQLLNNRGEVVYQSHNNLNPTLAVKPATYKIRVLIDSNNDGKWSYGNLLKNEPPEEVYLFPESLSVRENWIIEDINISF